MITGRQIKAARALADLRQDELANLIGLTVQAIRKIEAESVQPREGTINDMVRIFTDKGVEFTDNQGVKLKPQSAEITTFEGVRGFSEFYDFVYEYLKKYGGDVCVGGVDESLFSKYRQNPEAHRERMAELVKQRGDISMRILIEEGDYNFAASTYASYRWQAKEYFSPTSFYSFGNCLALISFTNDPPPLVVLIRSAAFADAYRNSFELAWANAQVPPPPRSRK